MTSIRFRCREAALQLGMDERTILHFIEEEWILPSAPGDPSQTEEPELDIEDLARCKLIRELREDFGVNDEAIPIILRLLDQIHFMEAQVKRLGGTTKPEGEH